jgi:amino acid adenylation domain-containing protein
MRELNYLAKENVQEVWELSLVQKALLSGNPLTQASYRITGLLDRNEVEKAWNRTVSAHPGLRSVFRTIKNRTVQVVLKERPIELEWLPLTGLSQEEQEAAVETTAQRYREPLHAETGPLVHILLCQLKSDLHMLVLTHHPLCMDDTSRNLLVREWFSRLGQEGDVKLAERRSYRDYLAREASLDGQPAKEYWSARLSDFESAPLLQLSSDSNASIGGNRRCQQVLSSELSDTLKRAAEHNKVSIEALMMTAWLLLLNVYSGETTVTCGITIAGRPLQWEGTESVIGPFSHVLPIRTALTADKRIRELLTEVEGELNQLKQLGSFPAEAARRFAGLPKDLRLFDSIVTVNTGEYTGEAVSPLPENSVGISPPRHLYRGEQEHLEIHITIGDCWEVELLHPGGTETYALKRLLRHLSVILDYVAREAEAPLHQLKLLPADEQQLIDQSVNRTRLVLPNLSRLAHQVIEDQAASTPDKVAAIDELGPLTYSELNRSANRLAHWLQEQGVERDGIVAVIGRRRIPMLVSILAVLKAGGAYVPLDPAHPDARLAAILESSGAKVVLADGDLLERFSSISVGMQQPPALCSIDTAALQSPQETQFGAYSDKNPDSPAEPADLANVFFTSGSTGQPKGAMVEHVGMLNHLYAKINLLGLDDSSVVAQNASHCFDISVWQFLAPLMTGGRVVIYPNECVSDPQALFHAVARDHVTVLEMVPAVIEMVLQASYESGGEESQLPELRDMISTGEGLPVTLCRKWLERFPHTRVINTYGATECSDDTSHEVITGSYPHHDHPQVSLGASIPNMKHYVLDAWLRPVPVGCTGELYMTGIGVGRGYLNDPERTAASFLVNPFADGMGERMYKSGDLARILPDGRMVFVSRADFQVKVRGYRIELGEIEAALLSHPEVRQVLAAVKPAGGSNHRIAAYIVLQEPVDVKELRAYLQSRLPEYMIPEHLIVLDAMPLNRNGKIDRKALPEPSDTIQSNVGHTAPRSDAEEELVRIWEAVLGVSGIGIDDNFFELGGHSLKTIQIRSRIKQQLGMEIALKDLFYYQTIREFSDALGAKGVFHSQTPDHVIPQAAPSEYYPMSHAQRRLYLLNRLEPDNHSYNMPTAIEITGDLNLEAISKALEILIIRHEGLRTTFGVVEDNPVQKIHPAAGEFRLPVTDLSQETEAEQCTRLEQVRQEESAYPFHLEEGPLFHYHLYRLSNRRHILWMNMHHIIGDYWSWQILLQELTGLYDSFEQGKMPVEQPGKLQYKDYAVWQNRRLEQGGLADAEHYWLNRFSDSVPVLDLPTDYARPAVQTFHAASASRSLDLNQLAQLKDLAKQQDATLFMVMLSSVGAFLSRLSGQSDLVIGTPEAGRNHMDLEGLIGFFVNSLPLRLNVNPGLSFISLLQQCKQAALDAYTHHEFPFDCLVEKISPERDLSRPPVFSVMFQLNHQPEALQLGTADLRGIPLESDRSNFDLTFVCEETASGLTVHLQYRTDLFKGETIERWLEHFGTLVDGILKQPLQPLGVLPVLNAEQRKQLLIDWNATEEAYSAEVPFHERFVQVAEAEPDRLALEYGGESMTYRELHERSNQLARYLHRKGVASGARVAVCMERSMELVAALLGILKAGAAYVPLDPAYPQERLSYMLEASAAGYIVADRLPSGVAAASGSILIELPQAAGAIEAEIRTALEQDVSPHDTAYIIYTSGSTGKPKGVEITHRSLANFLHSMAQAPGITREDRLLSVTTLSFDICALELYLPLTVGAAVILADRHTVQDGQRLAARLDECQATVMQATPATWRMLLAAGWQGNPKLRILCGGESWSRDLAQALQVRSLELWNVYGPTETTIWSSVHHVKEHTGPVSIGRPILNTRMYVLDSYMQPVPVGVSGELYIGGAGVAKGYYSRPELTEERFIANPFVPGDRLYRTGDLAIFRSDGTLECFGRQDHQVKIRGFRIELAEIEAVLQQHAGVREAAVIAHDYGEGDRRLAAFLVSEGSTLPPAAELRAHCQALLPEFMVPSLFVELDAMPLTPNGKLDRKLLQVPKEAIACESYVPPRDLTELQMIQLWERILNVKPIGIYDNFFVIGGHSLKALQLIHHIKEHFGTELPLSRLFMKPTVSELCSELQYDQQDGGRCLIRLQQGNSSVPPLVLVHPQGGGVLNYAHLVRELGPEQTVFGLQAVGYESDESPLTSIEEMAELYVNEIQQLVPEGPYRLAGWSFGGTVAYEMARIWEAKGQTVEFVGLIDTHPLDLPGGEREAFTEQDAMLFFAVLFDLEPESFAQLEPEAGAALLLQHAIARGDWPASMTLHDMKRKIRVLAAAGQAMTDYRYRGPIHANLHLFCVRQVSKHLHNLVQPDEWKPRTTGAVEYYAVPGDHTTLGDPPHVKELAQRMLGAINNNQAAVLSGGSL